MRLNPSRHAGQAVHGARRALAESFRAAALLLCVLSCVPAARAQQTVTSATLGGRLAAKLCAGLYRESVGLPRQRWEDVEVYPRDDSRPFCIHADGLAHPVSISHSGGWAAALVSSSAAGVGLDIEASSFAADTLHEMFGPAEVAQILGGDDARRRWTLKESYSKLTGRGVLGRPRDFVTLERDGRMWLALARSEATDGDVLLASAERGRLSISFAFAGAA